MHVGEIVTDSQTYIDLPVGSQVRGQYLWTKGEGGVWTRENDSRTHTDNTLSTSGRVVIEFIPAACRLRVGDVLNTVDDFDCLPEGTMIGPNEGEAYIKGVDGNWAREGHTGAYPPSAFSMGFNRVLSIPDGIYAPEVESLGRYKWRFRDTVIQGARNGGINFEPVQRALERLGVSAADFPFGTGVRVLNQDDRARLPEGTVVYVGSPDRWEPSFGVFVKEHNRFRHVMGPRVDLPSNTPITIDTIGGEEVVVDWWKPGDESSEEQIKAFKAKAWLVGLKTRRATRWCGDYERVMRQAGVTADCLRDVSHAGVSTGETVTSDIAAALPEGSVLMWVSTSGNAWAYYVRDDAADNTPRMRRLVGHHEEGRSLGNFKSSMTVVHIGMEGVGDMSVDLPPNRTIATIMSHLRPGSMFAVNHAAYIIARDGLAQDAVHESSWETIPEHGSYNGDAFNGHYETKIVRFGE